DDHSRYLLGLFLLAEPSGELTLRCLRRVFEPYGLPEAMLMDHGVPWWSNSNGHGLTQLSVALLKQGIRLYFSGVRHPQTQGKVERLHRTLEQALERAVPAARYRPSPRPYLDPAPRWEYESGSDVRRIDHKGCLAQGGQRLFVCEALAGEEVA